MALDKIVDSAILDANLLAVADAIRAKTGGTDALAFPDGMVDAIGEISKGENLDAEMETQGKLIAQIFKAIEGKVGSGGAGGSVAMVWNGHASAECYSGIYTIVEV